MRIEFAEIVMLHSLVIVEKYLDLQHEPFLPPIHSAAGVSRMNPWKLKRPEQ